METSEGWRITRRGVVGAGTRDEAREILMRRFPYGRIAGLYPARRSAGSRAWEYELELRKWSDRRRLVEPDG